MSMNTAEVQVNVAGQVPAHDPSFEFLRAEKIDSLNVTVEEYRHTKTGAMHYHIAADNPENVFLVAFRTVPMDSTGVAHILEHTALCGSGKYPVRDPFFMMIRRSLNTFMNAFTSSDWTAYPFASKNKKDFNNLLDVYLDAAFFSRLDELDFLQEGHRVEFSDMEDKNSPLEFKGVVFNEMKGAMSSPVSVIWQTITKYLYPTSTYHYNSGGEPVDIPDLSYQQLKDFYKTHYHPSNAVFMTFGDIPAVEHQQRFESNALSHFEKLDRTIAVDSEKRYLAPVSVQEAYAYDASEEDDLENKTHHVLGWLLGPCTSLDEMMKANLLSNVLLDNSSSPLRRFLETTELGSSPSPLCGLEDSNYEMCFLCGVEGSTVENATEFENAVIKVLEDVAENGVPLEQLEAVLHQIELSQREIGGDGYPYGLQLILEGLTAAIHRSDPVALLNLDPVIESLREQIKDPEFIKTLVKDYLLNNQHRVRLTMKPDTGLSQRKEVAEALRLEQIKNRLSDTEKDEVVKKALALKERQDLVDDPEVLPKVTLDDVPADIVIPEVTNKSINNKQANLYGQGTNGLVYQEAVFDLPAFTDDELKVLPYFSSCLTELGVGDKSYLNVQQWQSAVSGGVNGYSSVRSTVSDTANMSAYYIFSGKALERNANDLTTLMQETMSSVRFDEHARIKELISQKRARKEQSVTGSGHSLAMLAASSGICPMAALNHQLTGLQGIKSLKALDDGHKKSADKVAELADTFASIHSKIFVEPKEFMITAEPGKVDELAKTFVDGVSLSGAKQAAFNFEKENQQVKQLWVANTQVNFCARAYKTVAFDHEDAAALSVLGGFLRNGFLHTAIREKGGAYGGGAGHDTNLSAFRFFSYRDPRLEKTLEDFDRAIDWLIEGKHEWRQVEEAILGVIGTIDKPSSPAGEARQAYHNQLHGRSRDVLQAYRSNVLKVTLDDLKRVAETYLAKDKAHTAVITSQATADAIDSSAFEIIHL